MVTFFSLTGILAGSSWLCRIGSRLVYDGGSHHPRNKVTSPMVQHPRKIDVRRLLTASIVERESFVYLAYMRQIPDVTVE